MEYTIKKLAGLSGVTTRTLRYYDQIGLLCPTRISNGYRIYGKKEVDRLQQILLYREMGVELKQIALLLNDPAFDREKVLEHHLSVLKQEKNRLEMLIQNVTKTIDSIKKGDITMNDKEKFKGLKEKMIADNEVNYGTEIRQKYGDNTIDSSNKKLRNMEEEKFQEAEKLRKQLETELQKACAEGNPAGSLAQNVCKMHQQWICMFWPDGMYSKEAHKGLANLYVTDERFRQNYDKLAPGCAEFFRDAIYIYCA